MSHGAGSRRTLVLGIGNILMGDEGVGVCVARALQERLARPGPATAGVDVVDIVDGGTGGLHLLEYLQRYERVVLVDATLDGRPPGTVTILRPRFSSEYPPTLTAHDIGLKDLLDAAQLLGYRPDVILFAVSVREVDHPALELSPEIRAAVPATVQAILRHLESAGDRPERA